MENNAQIVQNLPSAEKLNKEREQFTRAGIRQKYYAESYRNLAEG